MLKTILSFSGLLLYTVNGSSYTSSSVYSRTDSEPNLWKWNQPQIWQQDVFTHTSASIKLSVDSFWDGSGTKNPLDKAAAIWAACGWSGATWFSRRPFCFWRGWNRLSLTGDTSWESLVRVWARHQEEIVTCMHTYTIVYSHDEEYSKGYMSVSQLFIMVPLTPLNLDRCTSEKYWKISDTSNDSSRARSGQTNKNLQKTIPFRWNKPCKKKHGFFPAFPWKEPPSPNLRATCRPRLLLLLQHCWDWCPLRLCRGPYRDG